MRVFRMLMDVVFQGVGFRVSLGAMAMRLSKLSGLGFCELVRAKPKLKTTYYLMVVNTHYNRFLRYKERLVLLDSRINYLGSRIAGLRFQALFHASAFKL